MTLLSAVCSAKVKTNNISNICKPLHHVHITPTNIDSDKKNEQNQSDGIYSIGIFTVKNTIKTTYKNRRRCASGKG
jgi:hypothetical protein